MTTWRGILRELERGANRNARQAESEEKQRALAAVFEEGSNTLNQYQHLLTSAVSLHKDCCSYINWEFLSKVDPPNEISKENYFEKIAIEKKNNFKPSPIKKIFGLKEKEILKLDEEINLARERDEETYKSLLEKHNEDFQNWEREKNLAIQVLNSNEKAFEQVLNDRFSLKSNPFIGKSITFHFDDEKNLTSDLYIHPIDEIIPSFDLKQLKSGVLSKKEMSLSKRLDFYKEYVCSAVIRLARETFAILPFTEVVINAKCDQLNKKTGYMKETIFLSVFIPKSTLDKINLQFVVPSIALENFKHNLEFKRLTGFNEVPQVSR